MHRTPQSTARDFARTLPRDTRHCDADGRVNVCRGNMATTSRVRDSTHNDEPVRCLLHSDKAVANTGFCYEVFGLSRVTFELLSQASHVDSEIVRVVQVFGSPNLG